MSGMAWGDGDEVEPWDRIAADGREERSLLYLGVRTDVIAWLWFVRLSLY